MNFAAINQIVLLNHKSFLDSFLPGGRFLGNEYIVRNPKRNDNREGSFKINIKTGVWYDFAIVKGGSDFISLYAYLNDYSQSKSAKSLSELFHINNYKPFKKIKKTTKITRSKYTLDISNKSISIQGTLAEEYLSMRGLKNLPAFVCNKLRFYKNLKHKNTGLYIPALIACVEDIDGNIVAIQRTYLDHKTSHKADIPCFLYIRFPCPSRHIQWYKDILL